MFRGYHSAPDNKACEVELVALCCWLETWSLGNSMELPWAPTPHRHPATPQPFGSLPGLHITRLLEDGLIREPRAAYPHP